VSRIFTTAARRHISSLPAALSGEAEALNRQFRAHLRQAGWDAPQIRMLLAITPAACAQLGSLAGFFEQVDYQGRRLAKFNVPQTAAVEVLEQFAKLLQLGLNGRFGPAREQLQLATRLVLNHAYYQVREAESQALFGLSRAAAEAEDLEDLLRRIVGVLTRAMRATSGWLVRMEGPLPSRLARPLYVNDPPGSCWSFPFGPSAVLQLKFPTPYMWLPREQALLAAAAARCREAWERARLQGEVRRLEAEARRAEEEERRRIGRELHDEAGQSMMVLRLQLELLERGAPPHLRPQLAQARELAGRTALELRRIVAALGPSVLERLGLEAALRQLVARFCQVKPVEVRMRIHLRGQPLSRRIEEVVYRVTQECLHNIGQHSRAKHVNLCLRAADKRIKLSVADDGAGFRADPGKGKPRSFGLAGMRERAVLLGGTLAVRSAPGAGTRVALELPLSAAPVKAHGKDSHIVG
jgi:signal transduction histidine kinase